MTWLALAVCLVVPPLVALWPALTGARFVIVFGSAAVAAFAVWCVVFLWIADPEDSGQLGTVLIPFYTVIHTFFAVAIVGIPWAVASERRDAR